MLRTGFVLVEAYCTPGGNGVYRMGILPEHCRDKLSKTACKCSMLASLLDTNAFSLQLRMQHISLLVFFNFSILVYE